MTTDQKLARLIAKLDELIKAHNKLEQRVERLENELAAEKP